MTEPTAPEHTSVHTELSAESEAGQVGDMPTLMHVIMAAAGFAPIVSSCQSVEGGCGAVLMAPGAAHRHYCMDVHQQSPGHHHCVCGVSWEENTTGVGEVLIPGMTLVSPQGQS